MENASSDKTHEKQREKFHLRYTSLLVLQKIQRLCRNSRVVEQTKGFFLVQEIFIPSNNTQKLGVELSRA